MEIKPATIKGVKTDHIKKEVTITFVTSLDDEMLQKNEVLSMLEGQTLRLEITAMQTKLEI